jgi:CheY-like chemotaxis protein
LQRRKSILLIEPEAPLRLFMWHILSQSGYTLFVATDGFDGLQKLSEIRAIDLMIVNLEMRGMTSAQLVQHAREIIPDLKVLFAHPLECFSDSASSIGWLLKPFDADELLSVVQRSLDGQAYPPRSIGIRSLS